MPLKTEFPPPGFNRELFPTKVSRLCGKAFCPQFVNGLLPLGRDEGGRAFHVHRCGQELKNLRIKTFVGNSENAVLLRIYTALTVYLLPAYQKFLSRLGLSVQQLFQLIQLNLLGAASLEELLNPR